MHFFNSESFNGAIIFNPGEKEIIRLENNGDIFVKGKLVENDKEVVDGLREFLKVQKSQFKLSNTDEKMTPILVVKAKENDFMITKGNEYVVFDIKYDNYYKDTAYRLFNDQNMSGTYRKDIFEITKDLREETKLKNNKSKKFTINTFENEEGIFAEIINEEGCEICTADGTTDLDAIKEACLVFYDILKDFQKEKFYSINSCKEGD